MYMFLPGLYEECYETDTQHGQFQFLRFIFWQEVLIFFTVLGLIKLKTMYRTVSGLIKLKTMYLAIILKEVGPILLDTRTPTKCLNSVRHLSTTLM